MDTSVYQDIERGNLKIRHLRGGCKKRRQPRQETDGQT